METPIISFEDQPIYIKITPSPTENTATVEYAYHTLNIKEEKSGYFSFYIPGFDIYFHAPTIEESHEIGNAMIVNFFHFWNKHAGNKGLIMEINRLGFKTDHHATTMLNLVKLRRLTKRENFKSLRPNIPNEFVNANSINSTAEISIAS